MLQAVDSNIFIYALESESEWRGQAWQLLDQLSEGSFVASQLVVTELLCKPYSVSPDSRDFALDFLYSFRRLRLVDVTQPIAHKAAMLMAQHGKKVRPLDALHLATALEVGARIFWTNDKQLLQAQVKDLEVRRLSDFAKAK